MSKTTSQGCAPATMAHAAPKALAERQWHQLECCGRFLVQANGTSAADSGYRVLTPPPLCHRPSASAMRSRASGKYVPKPELGHEWGKLGLRHELEQKRQASQTAIPY